MGWLDGSNAALAGATIIVIINKRSPVARSCSFSFNGKFRAIFYYISVYSLRHGILENEIKALHGNLIKFLIQRSSRIFVSKGIA